jgi:hypothetical protein
VWGMCVTVWVLLGLCVYACLCICVWFVWRDGVWVRGSGWVVMAWGWWLWHGHVYVFVVVVVFVGACVVVCVRCGVAYVAMLCGRGRRRRLVWMHVYCVG